MGVAGIALTGGIITAAQEGNGESKPTATPIERPQRNLLNQAAKDAANRALKRYLEAETTGCPSGGVCHKDTYDGTLDYRQEQTVPTSRGESSWFVHQAIKATPTGKGGVELDIDYMSTAGFTDTPGVYTEDTIKSASWREEELVLANPDASNLTTPLTPESFRAFLIDPDTRISRIKTDPERVTAIVSPDGIDMQYGDPYYGPKPEGPAVTPFVMKQVTSFADEIQ